MGDSFVVSNAVTRTNPEHTNLGWIGFAEGLFPSVRSHSCRTPDELGLGNLRDTAGEFFDMGQRAAYNIDLLGPEWDDHHPDSSIKVALDVSRVLQGLGSGVDLAIAALIDANGLLEDVQNGRPNPSNPLDLNRAMFLVESAIQYLVMATHNLTNLSLRLIHLDAGLRTSLATSGKPWSKLMTAIEKDARNGWVSHSRSVELAKVDAAVEAGIWQTLEIAAHLATHPTWQPLQLDRDRSFHRWRDEYASSREELAEMAQRRLKDTLAGASLLGQAMAAFYYAMGDNSPRSRVALTALLPIPRVVTYGPAGPSEEREPLPRVPFL